MKYIAILKDSFREAVDTWVFTVMVALSLVLIVIISNFGFRPSEPEDAIRSMVESRDFRFVRPDRGKSITSMAKLFFQGKVQLDNLKQLTDAATPTARDYSFTLTFTEQAPFGLSDAVDFWSKPTPEDFRDFIHRANGPKLRDGPVPNKLMEEFVKQQLSDIADLEAAKVNVNVVQDPIAAADKQQVGIYRFDIQTTGQSGNKGWPCDITLFFGAWDPQSAMLRGSAGSWVYNIENYLVNNLGGLVSLILGVIITAFFIPNMLSKGTIDMLVSKPINRPTLLVVKYIGGLAFMFLSSCVAIGGVWLVLGLRSGLWAPGFLLIIFTLTFFFAILYSVSTLIGVLTRSPIVSILVTLVVWFGLWMAGAFHQTLVAFDKDPAFKSFRDEIPNWIYSTVDTVHFVLPRTSDLDVLNMHLVGTVLTDQQRREKGFYSLPDVNWPESVIVSLVFIAIMLGLACWRFSRKDY